MLQVECLVRNGFTVFASYLYYILDACKMTPWSLISPASRGIGFALARRVLQMTNAPVVATARNDLDKTRHELLKGLEIDKERLTVLKIDVLGELLLNNM